MNLKIFMMIRTIKNQVSKSDTLIFYTVSIRKTLKIKQLNLIESVRGTSPMTTQQPEGKVKQVRMPDIFTPKGANA